LAQRNKPGPPLRATHGVQNPEVEQMVEVMIATGIAVMLVVVVIDGLAAPGRIGPQEMALLRAARAAAAQRRLMAAVRR